MAKTKTIELRNLVDMPEIARRAKVSKPTVRKWRARHTVKRVGRTNAFPEPVWSGAIGDQWDWNQVKAWLDRPRVMVMPPRGTQGSKKAAAAS